jgi:phosphoribosylformylglycinamidine synthase
VDRLPLGVDDVRAGKRFEVSVSDALAADPGALEAEVRRLAETLLANTVIEDFTVRVEQ